MQDTLIRMSAAVAMVFAFAGGSFAQEGAPGRDTSFGFGIVQAKDFLDTMGWGNCSATQVP